MQTFVSTIIESVGEDDGLSIVGFGSFKLVATSARTARNPRTGETVKIGARKLPKFTPGAAFLDAVDAKRAAVRAAAASAKAPLKKAAAKKTAPAKRAAASKR